jgi:hypothetical protein
MGEVYGFDGGKLVKGRKRHLVVDTQELLLGVNDSCPVNLTSSLRLDDEVCTR